MATAFVIRKKFRVVRMLRLATTTPMPPTTMALANSSTLVEFAEATAFPLGLAIVKATCSTPAAFAVEMASPLGLAIATAMC